MWFIGVIVCGDGGVIRLGGDDLGTEGGVGGEYAMEANEMEAGTRDQGGWPGLFMGFSTTTANCAPSRAVLARRSSTYCEYASVAPPCVRPDLAHIWLSRHENP